MNTDNMIKITGVDLVELVKTVYDMSDPVGMGYMHYREGSLSDHDAQMHIDMDAGDFLGASIVVGMDYVHGRCCKFNVHRDNKTKDLYIMDRWSDHSKKQLNAILSKVGILS